MRQRQKRQPATRSDVDQFLRDHRGNRELCRKSLKYVRRTGGVWNDIEFLRALKSEFFEDGESCGALLAQIITVETGEHMP